MARRKLPLIYAQQLTKRGKYRSPLLIGLAFAAAGDRDLALSWLEKAVDEHAPWLPELMAQRRLRSGGDSWELRNARTLSTL
jgi:hypothetical protein